MSTSTDGQICYGILFEEGFEFPWDDEKYEGCGEPLEAWWDDVTGYVPPHQPFTPEGEYAKGWTEDDPRFNEYFEARRKWRKEHPLPVELVNYCGGECPMYILAVKSSCCTANRGYPTEFDPSKLHIQMTEEMDLREFCKKHIPIGEADDPMGEPKWYLSSYWG